MISYGKIEIRRALSELLREAEDGGGASIQSLAARLLDDINAINALMDRTVLNVRSVVSDVPHIPAKGMRVSFWLVFLPFVSLWASVTVTVLLFAQPLMELMRSFTAL